MENVLESLNKKISKSINIESPFGFFKAKATLKKRANKKQFELARAMSFELGG